jgi:tRNA nucleotidyltransferase (CCA-adding enzyme)
MKKSIPQTILNLAQAIQTVGGRALLVGGCVRDMLLDREPKDFDIEVYGLAPEKLADLASTFGEVIDVGKAFGILKLRAENSPSFMGELEGALEIDLAIPRSDSKVADGHKGFDVRVDPSMSPADAVRRRDFTINAIMMDPLTGEVIDPTGGATDLEKKILRVVDPTLFGDDPLRVLRALQFVARFDLTVDPESMNIMKAAVPSLKELSPERLRDEWRKLLVLSEKPSIGLQLGFDLGVFYVLHPELPPMKTTPQNPEWHPEGDVWIHTLMVVDEAAAIVRREALDEHSAFTIVLGALAHDLGKPLVTREIDGKIRSIGHEEAGEAPARAFLKAVGVNHEVVEKIVGIVKDHLKPTKYYLDDHKEGMSISDGAIRKLAARIAPATMNELLLVAEADYFGRGQWRHGESREYPERLWLLDRAAKLDVLTGPAPHAITGQELIDLCIEPGPKVGELIREADRMRDDDGKTKEEIEEWIKNELRWM